MGAAVHTLSKSGSPLDAAEKGIRRVESDAEVHTVGYSGWPNLLGEVELDASLMDGDTMLAGAVGALKGFLHPITICRQIMERLPNILLVGEGAARFARECGSERARLQTGFTTEKWRQRVYEKLSQEQRSSWPDIPLVPMSNICRDPDRETGTTAFLVANTSGSVAAGVSSSGLAWKYPGRLGDSPLIGSGCYADSRYGAAACIGTGEMTIRAGTARSVVLYMKVGMTIREACREAVKDLKELKGGLRGDVTILALSRPGEHFVICLGESAHRQYWLWNGETPEAVRRTAEIVTL